MNNTLFIRTVTDVMEEAYINYAMSVITDRALPDVRDGLKPVHRRIMWAMFEAGNTYNKGYKKSARMVGDVIGKYHPHGDTSVYDAAVRMAQTFSMCAPLIDGQGNMGSVDGDNPAAMRYTEMRLTRLSGEILADINKETVSFVPNYDGEEKEPTVLPASYPNILVNGTDGIAVGMATSIPPHNLRSVINATILLLEQPCVEPMLLAAQLEAPDFPTGGVVYALDGFADAIETGRGRVKVRSKWHEEARSRGKSIIVDEIPYQINKAKLVEKIAELVREKRVEGITGLRDESNKDGMRIVIEIKQDEQAEAVFAALCAAGTKLEDSFSYNCTVLDGGVPKVLGLRTIIQKWITFRREVILARHVFERKQQMAKLHIMAGYMKAINQLDAVIVLIRAAQDAQSAKEGLIDLLSVDEMQAQAILSLRLQRLTGMELKDIAIEHQAITDDVARLTQIIESPESIDRIIHEELLHIRDTYGVPRRTEIGSGLSELVREDMITREDIVIVSTRKGYMKRLPISSLTIQNRGTRGRRSMDVGDDDEIQAIYQANTHDTLFFFADDGQVYARKGYRIPESGPTSKGRHVKNIIEGLENEIAAIVCVGDNQDASIVITTSNGAVKKSSISEYESASRKGGIKGIKLEDGNSIVGVFVATSEGQQCMMMASDGKAIRFPMTDLRNIGRVSQGVIGMRLDAGETIIGSCVVSGDADEQIVCIGENGIGKRTSVSLFPVQGRAGQGVIAFRTTAKTGSLISAFKVGGDKNQDVVMLASNGVTNRVATDAIRETDRNASGVILMNLDKGERVVSVTTVIHQEEAQE